MPRHTGDDNDREDRLADFDTTALLRAVDDVDAMREHLDGDGYAPPEIRNELLRLHQLAMEVVNEDPTDKEARRAMFELALEVEERIDDLDEALDRLRETIGSLVELAPDEFDE